MFLDNAEMCPRCDKKKLEVEYVHHEFLYGDAMFPEKQINIVVERLPVHTCKECWFSFVDDEGECIKHEAVCQALGVLTPHDIDMIVHHFCNDSQELSCALHMKHELLLRYMSGSLIQSMYVDKLLRAYAYLGKHTWDHFNGNCDWKFEEKA